MLVPADIFDFNMMSAGHTRFRDEADILCVGQQRAQRVFFCKLVFFFFFFLGQAGSRVISRTGFHSPPFIVDQQLGAGDVV
eukprot:601489-Hanusia_phi.AAC.2